MNRIRLLLRNLWFYRKPYLAVAAGVMVSTAILTGALIVGDSVQFSLRRYTDIRLGAIRYSLPQGERFFRQKLADELFSGTQIQGAPAIRCGAIAINSDKNLRINQVEVTGIDSRFTGFWDRLLPVPKEDAAILSKNVAEKLGLQTGDEMLLRIQKAGKTPANAPFSAEKEASVSVRVKIAGIVRDEQMGRFSLKSNQTAPFNIFVSLPRLASLLGMKGYANLLVAGDKGGVKTDLLNSGKALRACWKPEDAGLHFTALPGKEGNDGEWEITSDRIFFDDSTAAAIESVIPQCGSVLTYLVNAISTQGKSTPYSFVTAANENFLNENLAPGEIIVNKWLAQDLGIGSSDRVSLRYFIMGPLRTMKEDSAIFHVKRVIPDKIPLGDPQLMPDFPGMSDAGNCRDWETGAPIDLKKIRDKDERYWKIYRGTPKAFISLETGKKIWDNRFGHRTAFRFHASPKELAGIKTGLMQKLRPEQYGLVFQPVYREGQAAAGHSTDFGQLFLSLSFFIILSAVLLTAMLFALLARSRMAETAILAATGFRRQQIFGMLAAEALLVTLAGAIPGALAGILYNKILIFGLNTLWYDAVNTSMVVMDIQPMTLLYGILSGVGLSLLVLIAVLAKNLRNPLALMVKGDFGVRNVAASLKTRLWGVMTGLAAVGSALGLILQQLIHGQAMDVTLFLTAGALLLLGQLCLLNYLLARATVKETVGISRFPELVVKNLGLNRKRSMAVVTLLALGTFTIVITGANRRTFYGTESSRSSGTGGFLFWAQTTIPILNDLNTPAGARNYGLEDEALLRQVRFTQLTRLDGDDASCLNLNQVSRPALLGVPPQYFDGIHAFSFTSLVSATNPGSPWATLQKPLAPGMIAGFADQTVITWGLQKKTGDTLFYRDESGKMLKIKLMGGLENSLFQGNILVSDSLLHIFYPSAGGSRVMLVDGPASLKDTLASRLESLFRDQGMMITTTASRLATFNSVENTYLSVFMLLGGLGVILGTVGLGIVIFQTIRQRKREFAIYLALGFTGKFIFRLIVAEHVAMLLSAIFTGGVAALAGILPSLVSPGYSLPGLFLSAIILALVGNGLLWIWLAGRGVMKTGLLKALRDE
ncbi:MAG: FtsX-like permease family protein [Bacteroidota bacterium]